MKKKLTILVALILATILCFTTALATDIMLISSERFRSVSVQAYSSGSVTFSAILNMQCNEIQVSSCTLEYYTNGSWEYSSTLSIPSSKTNSIRYSATMNYSTYLSHGVTYRIVAIFSADTESVTTVSNSFTFY